MTQPAIPAHVLVKYGVYLAVVLVAHWASNWLIRKIIRRWKPEVGWSDLGRKRKAVWPD